MLEIRITIPDDGTQSGITFIKDSKDIPWEQLSERDRWHALYAMKSSDKQFKV